jgi:ferredoxin
VPGVNGETLRVDWTACTGRGLCSELLPELYDRDPWGYPLARTATTGGGEVPVPPGLAGPARAAVKACPRRALRLQQPDKKRS